MNKKKEPTKTPSPMESDSDTGFIILAAIRYAIGRRTYAPELITEWVKRYWHLISPSDRVLIQKTVTEAFEEDRDFGDDCDIETWKKFKDFVSTP